MPKRKLRIVKRNPPAIGVCERCSSQFKSTETVQEAAMVEIAEAFAVHKCKLVDSSQNALRFVRESTEGK